MQEKILVLDFGGQYNLLIARRIRQQHVYAEVKSYNSITTEQIQREGYKGIVFTGGPNSVYDPASPHFDPVISFWPGWRAVRLRRPKTAANTAG